MTDTATNVQARIIDKEHQRRARQKLARAVIALTLSRFWTCDKQVPLPSTGQASPASGGDDAEVPHD